MFLRIVCFSTRTTLHAAQAASTLESPPRMTTCSGTLHLRSSEATSRRRGATSRRPSPRRRWPRRCGRGWRCSGSRRGPSSTTCPASGRRAAAPCPSCCRSTSGCRRGSTRTSARSRSPWRHSRRWSYTRLSRPPAGRAWRTPCPRSASCASRPACRRSGAALPSASRSSASRTLRRRRSPSRSGTASSRLLQARACPPACARSRRNLPAPSSSSCPPCAVKCLAKARRHLPSWRRRSAPPGYSKAWRKLAPLGSAGCSRS
mmetsp:Transcript_15139/g.43215  ORF Transcript_15139/g.43215 Transcript_15139/m.43215 type:complete len:261 (-) Transcript_15139:769-1551(-)